MSEIEFGCCRACPVTAEHRHWSEPLPLPLSTQPRPNPSAEEASDD